MLLAGLRVQSGRGLADADLAEDHFIPWTVASCLLTTAAIGLLVWAALHDLAARTVPNILSLGVLVLGLLLRAMDHSLLFSLAAALMCFVLLFSIWLAGLLGGGDVKLWSATVLLIPPHLQVELSFFYRVLLGGGVLAILYISLRYIIHPPRSLRPRNLLGRALRAEAWRISRRAPLPYAFAISAGAILTLLPISSLALR
jgi:prepilin peptidase CpaA